METAYTGGEVAMMVLGFLLTISFGAWAAVVKKAADDMARQVERAINELSKLREEIHKDRLLNERRFIRLEQSIGIHEAE